MRTPRRFENLPIIPRLFWTACDRLFPTIKIFAAIDVTSRCNIKCAHCYWWKDKRASELDDDAMISFMRELRKKGKRAAILYGGEPMLRPKVCEAAARIFDTTLIFTNGTLGLLDIPARYMVSLDGTREVNDKIRGKGVYDKVMKTLECNTHYKPAVHITITRQNQHNIENFLEEMSRNKWIQMVGFSFCTPEKGKQERDIFIPLHERDEILDDLMRLRKKYWRIMAINKAIAREFKTTGAFFEWNSLETCPVSYLVDAFHADGTSKSCTYGDNADCSRCGCTAVASYRAVYEKFDPESLFALLLANILPRYR